MLDEMDYIGRYPGGEYQDRLVGPDGAVIWATPWQHNMLTDGLPKLLAALVKGEDWTALKYWAVGSGNDAWDDGELPSDDDRRRRTALYHETGRKALEASSITLVEDAPNQLEVSVTLTTGDIADSGPTNVNWRLREFGLLAGGPEGAQILINHRIHPRIDLEPGFTLQRTLRLTF